MQVKNSTILHFKLKIILGTKHHYETQIFPFQKDKENSLVWGGFSSVKKQLYAHQYFQSYWKLKMKKFSLAKLLKMTDKVVSLYIAGVAKVVPGTRQIYLSFIKSCVSFYCFIWNNHSSPVDNEVVFTWFSIEIWDTNWEISKIFCDKVGTWHKTQISAPNSLQTDPNYIPRALHGGTAILQMWKRSKTKLPINCSQQTKKWWCKGGYFYSDILASLCGGHITFSAPRNPPVMIVSEWNVVTDVIVISSPCRFQVMT